MMDNFKVFVPLDTQDLNKSISGDEHGNYVRGWASTPDQDKDGDVVLPAELDISHFLRKGYINYEHQSGEQFKIGVPTNRTYIDPQKGLYVEAKLFMDNPYAQRMWGLAKSVAKSGIDRPLGFSIEGKFTGRDADDSRVLKGVQIDEVALTTHPANEHATWQALVKSFETGYAVDSVSQEGAAALRRQSVARGVRSLAYQTKDFTKDDWTSVAQTLDEEDRFDKETATVFLQLCKGISKQDALDKIGDN